MAAITDGRKMMQAGTVKREFARWLELLPPLSAAGDSR